MGKSAGASLKPVLGFTGSYIAAAGAWALAAGNREFLFYILVLLVIVPVLYAVHRRYPLPAGLMWGFSVWGLVHMAGGLVPVPQAWVSPGSGAVLYSWWLIPGCLKYDQIVHAYGFGTTTWLTWHILRGALRSPGDLPVRPTLGVLVLCMAVGMGFGAFNEVVEFAATLTLPETNVGGYLNTGWDLIANLVGASVAAVAIRWANRIS